MSSRFSFITANFVARPIGYHMTEGWGQGDTATHAQFSPLATFAEQFGAMLAEIRALGFTSIDLWGAHLHWRWATPEHIEIARQALAENRLTVRSYAAWVPGGAVELRGACRLCAALRIPTIAGQIELFGRQRAEALAILREFGVRYGIENHPEKTPAELLAKLGTGDEDLVGIALDTGWCGTQGWDTLAAVRELLPRIFTVHLKDVKAPRAAPTGFALIDLGHETCRLGDGVVPIASVVGLLREQAFRGPIGLEHEPEEFDPREDLRESLQRVEAWWEGVSVRETAPPLRVAVVGCGNIAGAYGEALRTRPEIRILGASDIDPARAHDWVGKHGGRAYSTLDELLADPQVEAVVNLTIQPAHVEVVTRALNAGKHVHSEKPLAPTYEEARGLVDLATAKGLRLSCAPVTWLGEAQQTAWKAVRDGRLGTPRVAYATVDWARIESWHPNPEPFYAVGPVADVGVYPISLLTAWFGPVKRVTAGGGIVLPERRTLAGKPFTLTSPDWIVVVLEFGNGLRARLSANFYVGNPADRRAGIELHGDEGSLRTEWFAATAPVLIGPVGGTYRPLPPVRPPAGEGEWYCDWSAGVYELWRGLRSGTPHPTDGAQAAHVVDVIETVHRSLKEGRALPLSSSFRLPDPLEWAR